MTRYVLQPVARAPGEPRAAEVFIYGDIGASWWDDESVDAASFVRDLGALEADQITVRINSWGGSVSDGLAIYNALRRHPAHVVTTVDAAAYSIASLIAMSGDEVRMADNALLMVHAPWGLAQGNAVELRQYADVLDKHAQALATSYADQTGRPVEEMLALLTDGQDHWYTADEAVAAGFVDTVIREPGAAAQFTRAAWAARARATPPAPAKPVAAAAAHPQKEEPTMDKPIQAAATPSAPVDEAAIRADALAADQTRRDGIAAAFARFTQPGMADLMAACQRDPACTVEAAKLKLLDKLGEGAAPVAGGYVVTTEDETDKRRSAQASALLVRAGVERDSNVVRASASNPWRGYKLLDLARASLERAGVSTQGRSQMEIVALAFTQGASDFPVLLEEAMHKTLHSAYAVAGLTWNRFCATGSVSDFRAHKRYRLGSFGNLDSLNELGEFKSKAIPDGESASVTVGTKGNLINLSRQAVINDDLAAFLGLADSLGRAAARSVEADVYALLALNSGLGPTLADSKTLFHADHGNLTTGAALAMAAIDLDRVAMAKQKDVSGNDYLDLRPAVILVPLSLGGTARSINEAEYDPDTANKLQKPNTVRGLFRDVVDSPRLSGTRRYLFADPAEAPVIEVSFLDGNQTPYLEAQSGWNVDGVQHKVRLDYGVSAVDYRGAVTNAGQ